MDVARSSGIRKKRKSRSERDRERRSGGGGGGMPRSGAHARGAVLRFSSDSDGENSTNPPPSSSRPRPPRRKRKESTSAEEDIIDGFSISGFMTLEALEKNMSLKPQERRENAAGPLQKKRPPARVANGMTLDVRKEPFQNHHNNHNHSHRNHHHPQNHNSDQENNPRLAHSPKKKKHLQKKQQPLKPGQNNCKDSDSESVSGESKPSIRSSSRDRLTDCDSESDQEDKGSDASSEKFFSTAAVKEAVRHSCIMGAAAFPFNRSLSGPVLELAHQSRHRALRPNAEHSDLTGESDE
ncbi:autism susceptibility gene 2 protein homolog [Alosa pseudoharengus]|uniref:autism susceptibility gene 2 protein homolog n=1 Tax=Alosa pseudoharengus TaxID=34774 RepID=UPI003F8A4BEE